MNDSKHHDAGDPHPGDAALGALLRRVGPRPVPPPGVEERIRQAVAAEWRGAVLNQRRARRRQAAGWLAAAASVTVAAVAVWVGLARSPAPALAAMALVSRTEGPVQVRAGDDLWQRVAARVSLAPGETIATGTGGRAALALAGGVTLRLDESSRLVLVAPGEVRLESGAIYVDSGSRPAGGALRVESRFGATRHLGTLYQLRLAPAELLVSVREGRVVTTTAETGIPIEAAAGEQVRLSLDGQVQRAALTPHGAEWDWIHAVTPEFPVENRSLAEFLAWAARETGRDLQWASAADEAAARALVLRGSVAGLDPDRALAVVLSTTSFSADTDGGQLRVRRAPGRPPG